MTAKCKHEWAEGREHVYCVICALVAPPRLWLTREVDRLRSVIETRALVDRSSLSPTLIARNKALTEAADLADACQADGATARFVARRIRELIKE